jgi:hypothetical protein
MPSTPLTIPIGKGRERERWDEKRRLIYIYVVTLHVHVPYSIYAYSTRENIKTSTVVLPCSVPELSFIEPQGLTSDHVKELTEEVEKLAKENVGEV